MANLTITVTNPNASNTSNQKWMFLHSPYAEEFCTSTEMIDVILPARSYISGLPGFQSLSTTANNTTISINYTFDTANNADAAYSIIYNKNPNVTINTTLTNAQTLITNYRTSANCGYIVTQETLS
jgi:hypothetical protein